MACEINKTSAKYAYTQRAIIGVLKVHNCTHDYSIFNNT